MTTLTFPEFLDAFHKRGLYESIDLYGGSDHAGYDELKSYFHTYLQIGGYPEVVTTYLESRSIPFRFISAAGFHLIWGYKRLRNIFSTHFSFIKKLVPHFFNMVYYNILTVDEICREYCASRKAADFLMRLCASYDTVRQIYLTLSIILSLCKGGHAAMLGISYEKYPMTAGQTKYQTANKNKKNNGNHGFGTKLVNGEYHIHDGAGSDKIGSAYTVDADSLAQYQDALEQELFLRSRTHPLENKIEEKGEPASSAEEYDYESISKTFLEILGVKLDAKINWNADGTSELTEDQIQYLQEKYDVENMSKSEFYNLMAELSGMNVISHKDVEKQFLRHEDPAVPAIIAANEYFSLWLNSGNNYLSRFQNEERMYDDWIQALLDGRSSVQGSDILKARSYYEEQKESSGRLAGIFEKLKTNRNGKVKKTRNDGLEILGPDAPDEVKEAWNKAEKESGMNGMAMNAEGKLTQLTQLFVMSIENMYKGGRRDVLGDSVLSAKEAVQKALSRLGIPENREEEKEKDFYEAFLRILC